MAVKFQNTVEGLMKAFNKKSGETVMQFGPLTQEDPERLPTGVFQFDLATGGGLPMGRIVIFMGLESSMKTSIALKAIAQAQKRFPDKKAAFIDVEGRFSGPWATSMGVNIQDLVYVLPSSAEQVVDVVEGLLQAEDISIVVLDSLAAMITQKEQDSDAEQALVGNAGIISNKLYRKSTHALNQARKEGRAPVFLVINQIRYKIGVMMGNPETTPGGPSWQFASSMTIRLTGKDEFVKEVSDQLPSFKVVSCIIRKWSVPILQRNSELRIALLPIPQYDLKRGETYDWNTIKQHLKDQNLLQNDKNGWTVTNASTGEIYQFKKQEDIEHRLFHDEEWGRTIRDMLVKAVLKNSEMIDPE